jgi:hypothetical protein
MAGGGPWRAARHNKVATMTRIVTKCAKHVSNEPASTRSRSKRKPRCFVLSLFITQQVYPIRRYSTKYEAWHVIIFPSWTIDDTETKIAAATLRTVRRDTVTNVDRLARTLRKSLVVVLEKLATRPKVCRCRLLYLFP